MANIPHPEEALLKLVFSGLDHSFNSIEGGAGALVPFVMHIKYGIKQISRCVDDTSYAGSVKMAEDTIGQLDPTPDFALMAFDGYIALEDGVKRDTIFIKAFSHAAGHGYLFAHQYQPAGNGQAFSMIGKLNLLEVLPSPWQQS